MIAITHFLAVTLYLACAGLAAVPFARPMRAPVRGVTLTLAAALLAHGAGLAAFVHSYGQAPLAGLGPALSFAAFLIGVTLLVAELWARDVTLALLAAPFAALLTALANLHGMVPVREPSGVQGLWLRSHIALSFLGIAAFATAAGAGVMYLAEHRELKSRRFGAVWRFFPPLDTLDRVNHVGVIAGWLALTVGTGLAAAYSYAYHPANAEKVVWALSAWVAVTALTVGRVVGGWRARRAAVLTSAFFAGVVVLYIAFRMFDAQGGKFL